MKLIDKDAAIAAMRKATKGEAFNPFKVLGELPTVEAYTKEEIAAADADRFALCDTVKCNKCDYRELGCGQVTATRIDGLVRIYRKRKEESKC